MTHVVITLDVWCKFNNPNPLYHIYIDNDCLITRVFDQESSTHFIREFMQMTLYPGWHWITCEHDGTDAKFYIDNVWINGVLVQIGCRPIEARFCINS